MTDHAPLTGQVILLTHDDAFVAGYVRSVLLRSGAEVVGPMASEELEVLLLHRPVITAYVVGREHGSAIHHAIMRHGVPYPALLLLDGQLPDRRPRRAASLASPYAGYQVVDAMVHLLSSSDADLVELAQEVTLITPKR